MVTMGFYGYSGCYGDLFLLQMLPTAVCTNRYTRNLPGINAYHIEARIEPDDSIFRI